jgi:hypothetical protein
VTVVEQRRETGMIMTRQEAGDSAGQRLLTIVR